LGFGFGLLAATSVSASSACVARGAEWCEAGLEVELLPASSALVIDSCTWPAFGFGFGFGFGLGFGFGFGFGLTRAPWLS